jgi:hypothetical protein
MHSIIFLELFCIILIIYTSQYNHSYILPIFSLISKLSLSLDFFLFHLELSFLVMENKMT